MLDIKIVQELTQESLPTSFTMTKKGKLRKEASWNSWRDDKIPNDEFENVPIEGFVLNKKAGDYSTGWDHRHAYCRVYDPRGFEFEITIENLLYILENANCIKGKGLEGDHHRCRQRHETAQT